MRGYRISRTPDPSDDPQPEAIDEGLDDSDRDAFSTLPIDSFQRSAMDPSVDNADVDYKLKHHPIFEIPNVKRCVDIGALDMEMVALLNIIVPGLNIPETPAYLSLDEDTKEVLLQDLLVELIMTVQHPNHAEWTPNGSPEHVRRSVSSEDLALLGSGLKNLFTKRGLVRGLSTKVPDWGSESHNNISRHSRPVTMIIDDFHNADESSVRLLSGMLTHPDIGYSFILLTSSLEDFDFSR